MRERIAATGLMLLLSACAGLPAVPPRPPAGAPAKASPSASPAPVATKAAATPTAGPSAAAPTGAPTGLAPKAPAAVLGGRVLLEPTYFLASGAGKLVGNNGNALIGQDGGSMIGLDGGGLLGLAGGSYLEVATGDVMALGPGQVVPLVGNGGNTLVGNNGNALVGNNGNALVGNGGNTLVAKTKFALAQAAAPIGLVPARGMAVVAVSLKDGQVVAGPVLTGADGAFSLPLAEAGSDNVRLVARVPDQATPRWGVDPHLQYAVLAAGRAGERVIDEDETITTSYLLRAFETKLMGILSGTDSDMASTFLQEQSVSADPGFKLPPMLIAELDAGLKRLRDEAKAGGFDELDAAGKKARMREMLAEAWSAVDLEALVVRKEYFKSGQAIADDERVLPVLVGVVRELRELAVKAAAGAKVPIADFYKDRHRSARFVWDYETRFGGGKPWPYAIKKAADVADFATHEYWATNQPGQFLMIEPFLRDLGASEADAIRLRRRIDAAAQTGALRVSIYLLAPGLDWIFPPIEGRPPVDAYAVHCRAIKKLGASACPTPPPETP